jgi:hypothetical protein
MTRSDNPLTWPLYADKPQRRLGGGKYVAVTMHRSWDGTVASYALFTPDGASLGTANYHPKRGFRPRGYTMTSVYSVGDETWPTLEAFASTMAARLQVTTQGA